MKIGCSLALQTILFYFLRILILSINPEIKQNKTLLILKKNLLFLKKILILKKQNKQNILIMKNKTKPFNSKNKNLKPGKRQNLLILKTFN